MAAAPAPAAAPPLVLDAHADTLDHVVRAVAHSGFLPQAARLMLASPEHLHDPELLYRTRCVQGQYGYTLLMRAVSRLDEARAVEILAACPTPASRAELLACGGVDGLTALHIACFDTRLDEEAALRVVELLLANGANPLAHPGDPDGDSDGIVGRQAIHFAAEWSPRLVQRLLEAGASIDGDDEGESTLCAAAEAATLQGVRMIPQLVALGARETHHNSALRSFLSWLSIEGDEPTDAELLAALKALVSVGSATQPGVAMYGMLGATPLDCVASRGDAFAFMARELLALGAPATTSSLVKGVKHPEMVRVLLAAGAPINALVNVGPFHVGGPICSPLIAAVLERELESVEALLAAGASVDLRSGSSNTALMCSITRYDFYPRITEALLAAGADVNARSHEGSTALHLLAAKQAQTPWAAAAARLLLQRGASARALDDAGRTPAQRVPAAQHDGELRRLLLEAEAAAGA